MLGHALMEVSSLSPLYWRVSCVQRLHSNELMEIGYELGSLTDLILSVFAKHQFRFVFHVLFH